MKRDPTPKKKKYNKPDSITDRNSGYRASKSGSQKVQMWGYSLYQESEENGFVNLELTESVTDIIPSDSFCYFISEKKDIYHTGEVEGENGKVIRKKAILFKGLDKIKVQKLFTGSDFTFALANKGEVFCWGVNFMGQLGLNHNDYVDKPTRNENLGFKNNPTLIPAMQNGLIGPDERIVEIACGACHTVVLTSANRLLSAGHGLNYALGHNSSTSINYFKEIKFFTDNKLKVNKVDSGLSHSVCLSNGKLYIWGTIGSSRYSVYKGPSSISIDSNIADFCLGDNLLVAQSSKGEVFTMGENKLGQLGTNGTNDYLPNKIKLPYNADFVTCGNNHIIVVTKAKIYGWGSNVFGQLNPNSTAKEIFDPIELNWIAEAGPFLIKCRGNQTFVISKNSIKPPVMTTNGDTELLELKKIIENLELAYNNSKKENENLKDDFRKLHNTISEIDSYDKTSMKSDKNEDPVVKSYLISDEQIQK